MIVSYSLSPMLVARCEKALCRSFRCFVVARHALRVVCLFT